MLTVGELLEAQSGLIKFARRLTKGKEADAQDLLQETNLRALERGHQYESGTKPFAWLSKIMFNNFASDFRRQSKYGTLYGEEILEQQTIPPRAEECTELAIAHAAIVRWLPKPMQEILEIVAIQGNTYEEAAELLGIPTGTVRSRICRARQRLEGILNVIPGNRYRDDGAGSRHEDRADRHGAGG